MERRLTFDLQCGTHGEVMLACCDGWMGIELDGRGPLVVQDGTNGEVSVFRQYSLELQVPFNRRQIPALWDLIPYRARLALLRRVSRFREVDLFSYFQEEGWDDAFIRELLEMPASGSCLLSEFLCSDGVRRSISRDFADDICRYLESLFVPNRTARQEFARFPERP